jgi:hypothetical protein
MMFSSFYSSWKANRVKDAEAPVLYSQVAIYWFSVAFSVFTGAILMAINLRRFRQYQASWLVVLYGLAFTVVEMYALSNLRTSTTAITFIINSAGAYVINEYFWKRYFAVDMKYRANAIVWPLVICLALTISLLALIILYS